MPNVTAIDDTLADQLRRGDQAALGRIVEKYSAYVGTIVWNIVGEKLSRADAEEIISDVFSTLWYNADKVREGKLKGYLSAIARSRALNALRAAKQDVPLEEDTVHIPVPGPEDEAIRQAEYAALHDAVDGLPEPDRSIFLRHYFLYQSVSVIADEMQLNVNTVKTKLRRGRERLRRELTEGGYFIG